ncbi:MAG: hypothetical protein Tsb0020_36610 [Haliangiales bacterium]
MGHSATAVAGDEQQCSSLACTGNSPKVLSHDLNPLRMTPGEVSDSGFTTDGIQLDGQHWLLDVQDGELLAMTSTETRSAAQLVGGEVVVFYGGDEYRLKIIDYRPVEYWTRPGEYRHLYRLQWSPLNNPERFGEVCEHPIPSNDPDWGPHQHYGFFIAGEKYNIPSVAVQKTGGGASDTLYVACAGSALAKAEMNSYSPNVTKQQHPGWDTFPWERELLLRAYTAGYGYGELSALGEHLERFTVPHEPLLIEDPRGWMDVDLDDARTVEAVWAKDGLVCLEEPRRLLEDPAILEKIEEVITDVPTCAELGLDDIYSRDWRDHGQLRTLLPFEY